MKSKANKSRPKHLSDYLQHNAQRWPDRLAIDDGRVSLTWNELWSAVQPIAFGLAERFGAKNQKAIGLLMPNSCEYVISYLAVVHAGHMALPIDVIFKPLEIEAVIKQVKPEAVITDRANTSRINPKSAEIITFDDLAKNKVSKDTPFLRIGSKKQIASLFFTSGTTGRPKLAPNTHANHIWNIKACSEAWGWNSDDSLLLSVRLSHMLGLVMGLSGALYHGNTLYMQDRFDPVETLEFLSSGKASQFSHGPIAYTRLLDAAKGRNYDLSKVKLFISGSAPLPPATWHEFKKRFGHEILEVYGTTETGRIASNLKDERITGSPGRLLSGVELRIGENGEVLVKSPGVFPGYFNNDKATKESLGIDGFWNTGDIGEIKDGRLYLKGRSQEKIRRSGYTISPRDIEWAMHKMPGVKEVYVLGLQQPGAPDDLLVYYVVSESGQDEIIEFCKANMPSVWRPDKIILLEQIPRTRNGKPEIVRLKSLAKSGAKA